MPRLQFRHRSLLPDGWSGSEKALARGGTDPFGRVNASIGQGGVEMYRFRNSDEIRRRWLLFGTLAIVFFMVGVALLLYEIVLLATGARLSGMILALTIMAFGVPTSVLWSKSKDLSLWWREELEREESRVDDQSSQSVP